jgi:hypothetical protein
LFIWGCVYLGIWLFVGRRLKFNTMKIKYNVLFFVLICTASSCNLEKIENPDGTTAVDEKTFQTKIGVGTNQRVYVASVLEAVDDGYIISGSISATNANITKVFVTKTSATGSSEKTVSDFGAFNNLSVGKLIRTTDNKYALAATEDVGGGFNIVVVKLKDDLQLDWAKRFVVTNAKLYANDIVETADGHFLVAGAVSTGTNTSLDPYFLKVRTDNGMEVAKKTVDITATGSFKPVSIARNGNAYGVFGYNFGISIPSQFFVKIDQNLNPLAQKTSLALGNGDGEIAADASDGYVIADGFSSQLSQKCFILKISGNGDETGRFDLFDTATRSGFTGIAKTADGRFILVGWTSPNTSGNLIASAALVSPAISTQSTFIYGDSGKYSEFAAAAPAADGGFVFAGQFGENEILLVKVNKNLKLN